MIGIPIGEPFCAKHANQLFVAVFGFGVCVLVVVEATMFGNGEAGTACIEKCFRSLDPFGEFGKGLVEISGAQYTVVSVPCCCFRKPTQQFVPIHRPKDSVAIPVPFVSKSEGVQCDEAFPWDAIFEDRIARYETQFGLLPRPNSDPLASFQSEIGRIF